MFWITIIAAVGASAISLLHLWVGPDLKRAGEAPDCYNPKLNAMFWAILAVSLVGVAT